LGERLIDCFSAAQANLIFIGFDHRTNDGALAAGGAVALMDEPRPPSHLHMEVANVAGDLGHFAQGQELDLGMSTDIHHLGAEYSYRAIHGGKGLVQLGHDPADGRFSLHQIYLMSGIG
jgi:hypothetical protein